MSETFFRESQRFNQWGLWILLQGIGALLFYVPSNLDPIILIAMSLLFLSMRLITQLDQNGLKFHFFPFVRRSSQWHEIASAWVVDYGFVSGWGIRLFTSYGTVSNVKGSRGLTVELEDGKKILSRHSKAGGTSEYYFLHTC